MCWDMALKVADRGVPLVTVEETVNRFSDSVSLTACPGVVLGGRSHQSCG